MCTKLHMDTRCYGRGECYDIPADVLYTVKVKAVTVAVDVLAEPVHSLLKAR